MSCFVVPLVQAIATTAYRRHSAGYRKNPDSSVFKRHLPALEKMLWGGTLMLVVDHVINGELSWRFPFFTALGTEGGFGVMLREMLTVGVPMSLVLTAAWALYAVLKERRTLRLSTKLHTLTKNLIYVFPSLWRARPRSVGYADRGPAGPDPAQ